MEDLFNIDNIHFEYMVQRKYPTELSHNIANASDTEAAFLYFNLSIHNETVSILGNPKPKKMLIFRFVGIFEYIILLM